MILLLQRVSEARVRIDGAVVGEIATGLLVFVGVEPADTADIAKKLAERVVKLRLFPASPERSFEKSLADAGGAVLAVSQFTLPADLASGLRPGFTASARPEVAEPLYDAFCAAVRAAGIPVETGRFGADMQVELINDGPATFILRS